MHGETRSGAKIIQVEEIERRDGTGALDEPGNLKRLNRARDFFGDPMERLNHRLALQQRPKSESYADGSLALVIHLRTIPEDSVQPSLIWNFRNERVVRKDDIIVFLKSNIVSKHKLEDLNRKLVLIPDVHLVQGPKGWIPTLKGTYIVQNEVSNWSSDLLLFERAIEKGSFELLPRFEEWKPCPPRRSTARFQNCLIPQQIDGATQVVHSVPYDNGAIDGDDFGIKQRSDNKYVRAVFIGLDGDGVEICLHDCVKNRVQLINVFYGPFNFFV